MSSGYGDTSFLFSKTQQSSEEDYILKSLNVKKYWLKTFHFLLNMKIGKIIFRRAYGGETSGPLERQGHWTLSAFVKWQNTVWCISLKVFFFENIGGVLPEENIEIASLLMVKLRKTRKFKQRHDSRQIFRRMHSPQDQNLTLGPLYSASLQFPCSSQHLPKMGHSMQIPTAFQIECHCPVSKYLYNFSLKCLLDISDLLVCFFWLLFVL